VLTWNHCNPFKYLDDTLFDDFISEEVLEDPLDATSIFEEKKTKCCVLRIKPLVMERRWRSMSIKRNVNFDEVKHVENPREKSLSFLPLNEVEVVQTYSPPAREIEEATSLNDEESEDPFEFALTSVFPTHEDKELVFFSHTDGLVKEPLDMVD
jgi:hypothetical protein